MLFLLPVVTAVGGDSSSVSGKAPPKELIKDYVRRNTSASSGNIYKESKMKYVGKDINGDGSTDWFLYESDLDCGSGGCYGDVYICKNTSEPCKNADYCYAGGGRNDDVLNKPHPKLTCATRPNTVIQ